MGTINSQELMLNVFSKVARYKALSLVPAFPIHIPAKEKRMSVINIVGPVVRSIYLICVNNGVPLTEEARTVVSLKGEILSPKYAPEIMAPAIHPSSKPCALPIPKSATPIVAIVVHEEPVMTETIPQITHADIRNTEG